MKISQQDILQLAAATTGQRNNALWHQMKLGRLTASNFGAVIAAVGRNRYITLSNIISKATNQFYVLTLV